MKITDLFIKRPVLAMVINLLILIAGLVSINTLSVRQYPRSDIAVVTVKTVYVGANADLVRGYITTPLERVIASADGIDYMESSSAQGLSTITVHLRLNFDTNAALTQIQAKVAQVRNELPPEAEAPVIEVESKDSEFAAMYLSFYSEDLDQNRLPTISPALFSRGFPRSLGSNGRTFWALAYSPCASGSSPINWLLSISHPQTSTRRFRPTIIWPPLARPKAR